MTASATQSTPIEGEEALRILLAGLRAMYRGAAGPRMPDDQVGLVGEVYAAFNQIVQRMEDRSSQIADLRDAVQGSGDMSRRLSTGDLSGTWRARAEAINTILDRLTDHSRSIERVVDAVSRGDLTQRVGDLDGGTTPVRGDFARQARSVNDMVALLARIGSKLTDVAQQVGVDGKLGAQARVEGVAGSWKDLTDGVNLMARNLTSQVREIARVTTAVAQGDLTQTVNIEVHGEIRELKHTINTMVDQLGSFASEVTRVAREVGTEGTLGVQADVKDVSGIWKELTDNVNLMGRNLTDQVRDIAAVTTAVANGDLSKKITVEVRGEILELKNTINAMVDQLGSFADEVTRLASEVGVEGKLGGQADVRGVSGTWRDLTDAVNSMASNLTDQVRNISQVATAIAQGDLEKKIVVDAKGEILELKNTINVMVDQLGSFAEEVTRVAREVGTEGKLGGQASVEGVRGIWKELTDNVNLMASNLTNQVRDIAHVSTAIAQGDLGKKITVEVRGELLDLKKTINTMIDQLSSFAEQVTRVARDVGVEGKLGGQAEVRGAEGIWRELTDNVNLMASNLTNQVRDIADVTTAVANGDLSRKITVEVRGEIFELKKTINTMVDQLSAFAAEVTRMARQVGTDGILGVQAEVRGVSGTWRELTDNVNVMARNLTEQVRGIARVVTAVANGELKKTLHLDAKGEIATLVDTINNMIVTLSTFADQVTGVARDVGVEGRLGGQADVPGAAGVWRDLTNNVNELAGNLTRQVRAIGDVATAVTKGDLTQSITVEARGEVAVLKDNLNQMIQTLAETTRLNQEQDWLKTNLTRFTRMLQGQRDLLSVAQQVLSELAPVVDAQYGAFYGRRQGRKQLWLLAGYAMDDNEARAFGFGEGLVGQAAADKKPIVVDSPPDYVRVSSALGSAQPRQIVVMPVLFEDEVKGVLELASFQTFTPIELAFLEQLLESLGIVLATIEATMRTDTLLRQSQSLAEELQQRQEDLQRTNAELENKARQLTNQKSEVERKNHEVELARQELEAKAKELALTSSYKSQFLANMSHELRTPLNSLLILSKELADNAAGNLDANQVEYASTVHQAGSDLLELINEILDLAKIESGTMAIAINTVNFGDLRDYVERSFGQIAAQRRLAFSVELNDQLPECMSTDEMRLKQVLRNLLSNAFKFTSKGEVRLRIHSVDSASGELAGQPGGVIGFTVSDTGIGIAADQQKVIFEAFQQADGGTSRRYGGTGLGLSISREIARLLGGELRVKSTPKQGSSFTLLLPCAFPRTVAQPPPGHTPARGVELVARPASGIVLDDRATITDSDRTVLIVEDDPEFARALLETVREAGFRGIVAEDGATGLEQAREARPQAITLDLSLPDMDGWVLLDRLKHDGRTRHIPVYIMSGADEEQRGLQQGAMAFLHKPADHTELHAAMERIASFVDTSTKRLLLIASDPAERSLLADLVGNRQVRVDIADSSDAALAQISAADDFDCVIIDGAMDCTPEILHAIGEHNRHQPTPIIAYGCSDGDGSALSSLASGVIWKNADSPERVLEQASLFLHRLDDDLPERGREVLRALRNREPSLAGCHILVVDDDVRNIFAITAILERHGMRVSYAENGREALDLLDERPDIELVLMDIMMPEMDGYEAIRRMRAQPQWHDLPIIALTAKAMKGDRERCLTAGASDYITKPVDPEHLVSMLRVWRDRRGATPVRDERRSDSAGGALN